jgi:4-hydroxy-4-methyl-2-oxoglutarate aldolase
MFTVNPLPPQIDPALLARLATCETAIIGHFLHAPFMHPQLRAVIGGRRVAGTAVTAVVPGVDGTMMHWAIGHARPGDFLVIDRAGDRRHACWGGILAVAAKSAGIAGAVIDGYATDFEEIRAQEVPLWCLGPSPVTTKLLGLEGAFNVEASCGGVAVRPGDAILADESGVVVLRPWEIEDVVAEATRRLAAEPERMQQLRAGKRLHDLTGAGDKVRAALAPSSKAGR